LNQLAASVGLAGQAPSMKDSVESAAGRGAPTNNAAALAQSLIPIAESDARKKRLESQFGKATNHAGGRDHYVIANGGRVREVLIDPASSLPVEINDAEGSTVKAHTTLEYGRHGDSWMRERVRTERTVAGSPRERIVTDMRVENVRFH
jgi:hypothetical protein